jgi:hypothetical protein
MRFHQEQRYEGGWRWFWAGVMLGPGAAAAIVLFGVAAATGADLMPTLLLLAGLEFVALLGLILLLRTPVIVEVTDESIRVHGPLFFREEIPAADVTSDDAGVVVMRSNGWRIVIGSKRPAELAEAIRGLTRPPRWD